MEPLGEVLPVFMGAVIGVVVWKLVPARLRWIALGVLSVIAGVLASAANGELEISAIFVPIDVAQVVIAAVLTYTVARMWERRAADAG